MKSDLEEIKEEIKLINRNDSYVIKLENSSDHSYGSSHSRNKDRNS